MIKAFICGFISPFLEQQFGDGPNGKKTAFIKGFLYYFSMNVYPHSWQLGFQEPATAMMSGIVDLHHDIMAILVFILGFVSVLLVTILFLFSERVILNKPYTKILLSKLHRNNYYTGHGITYHTALETIWTIIPTVILLIIATPSFALIYALDEVMHPELTIRVIGRQWYWSYEYPDGLKQTQVFYRLPPTVGQDAEMVLAKVAQRLEIDSSSCFSTNPSTSSKEDFIECFPAAKEPFDELDWSLTPHFIWLMEATKNGFRWDDMAKLDYNRQAGDFSRGPAWGFFISDPHDATVQLEYPVLKFNSYMLSTDDLPFGTFRLLEVDKRLVVPVDTCIRFLVTSDDVLHSWTVPSFGIKVDAVPGRTNEYYLVIQKCGVYYGQCSEICGVNHGFMPIKVEVVPQEIFRLWYLTALITDMDDDGSEPPMSYEVRWSIFFKLVDELIPFFCDNHGYEPIEMHRKAVQTYFDGGWGVSRFLGFRHLVSNIIVNAFFKDDGYPLKPTNYPLDIGGQYVSRRVGLFDRLGYSREYVEKYKYEDRPSESIKWMRMFPKDFYSRPRSSGFYINYTK